jgi:transglutaminase-like putative cysteine protease
VGQRHITIGHGRDYADVPPVRGTYSGRGRPTTDAVVEIRRHASNDPHPLLLQHVAAQQQ